MVSRAVVSAPRPPPPASGLRIPFNRRYFPPPRRVLRAGRFQRTDGFVPVPRHDRPSSRSINQGPSDTKVRARVRYILII